MTNILKFKKLKDFINNNCIQIGSRKFGLNTEKSDYDYVCDINNKNELQHIISSTEHIDYTNQCDYGDGNDLPMYNLELFKIQLHKNIDDIVYIDILFYYYKHYKVFDRINELFSNLIRDNSELYVRKNIRLFAYNNLLKIVFKEVDIQLDN